MLTVLLESPIFCIAFKEHIICKVILLINKAKRQADTISQVQALLEHIVRTALLTLKLRTSCQISAKRQLSSPQIPQITPTLLALSPFIMPEKCPRCGAIGFTGECRACSYGSNTGVGRK